MKATSKKPRRSKASRPEKDKQIDTRSVRIVLTQVERELLLKACLKYRYTIPAYIQSKQAEAETLDAIVSKLS
ncbi:MAG: hypothetical protein P8X96_25420 [Desulfobacteraceae bacterium]|jgi:hypothetical protein